MSYLPYFLRNYWLLAVECRRPQSGISLHS